MERSEIKKFLHDLNNHLNAVNLNTCLLKALHTTMLDEETVERLESAIQLATKSVREFQNRVHAESDTTA